MKLREIRLHEITSKGLVISKSFIHNKRAFSASVVVTTKLNLTLLQEVRSVKSREKSRERQVSYLVDLKVQALFKRLDRIAEKYQVLLD